VTRRAGVVAMPRSDCWNCEPTTLLGGVGTFLTFAAGLRIWNDDPFYFAGVLFPKLAQGDGNAGE